MKKIKRYRLGVSRNFPTTHPKKVKETWFIEKIQNALHNYKEAVVTCYVENYKETDILITERKIHTIRSNYELWSKRMAEVHAGRAVIELFYWSGKPYHKDDNGIGQVVFATLDKDSGCGVQALIFPERHIAYATVCGQEYPNPTWYKGVLSSELAKNDGLSFEDFKAWFKGYDLSKPMAIIHFTKFRY